MCNTEVLIVNDGDTVVTYAFSTAEALEAAYAHAVQDSENKIERQDVILDPELFFSAHYDLTDDTLEYGYHIGEHDGEIGDHYEGRVFAYASTLERAKELLRAELAKVCSKQQEKVV